MRPSRDSVIRLLLHIGRAETTSVCGGSGITLPEDPTNRSLRYARNRIRRRVLPELALINPQVASALARLADAAADVATTHRERAEALFDAAARDGTIDLDALGTDEALREQALAIAWERATGRVLTARHRRALVARGERGDGRASLDLPGGRLIREHRAVRIDVRTDEVVRERALPDRASE